jgi:5-bromo-4-chloroindolyl phosphate hydrolysis protein
MIIVGMFPEGHIDEQKTCFMLNNESYQQYLKLQESIRMKQVETQQKQKEEQPKSNTQNSEFTNAILEGRSYIRQIREANDVIQGEEISRKMSRLENIAGKIFDYVEGHPEQFSEIHKFMDYYLPTTIKLLNAYKELDIQPVQGENITSAKKEIEGTLDTINLAFENLLDSLFGDIAMDVSTDISVLETMLAQEGLTKKDF